MTALTPLIIAGVLLMMYLLGFKEGVKYERKREGTGR